MDKKSEKYLESVKKEIGLIREFEDREEIKLLDEKQINVWVNNPEVSIGKTIKGYWCAKVPTILDIDDCIFVYYIFSKEPTIEYIRTLNIIEEIEFALLTGVSPYFRCWECGKMTHWTDIKGSIGVKFNAWMDRYCNNC